MGINRRPPTRPFQPFAGLLGLDGGIPEAMVPPGPVGIVPPVAPAKAGLAGSNRKDHTSIISPLSNDLSLVFLTSNFSLPALIIAAIAASEWQEVRREILLGQFREGDPGVRVVFTAEAEGAAL